MKSPLKNMKIATKLLVSYLFACVLLLVVVSAVIYKVSSDNLEDTSLEFASVFSSQIVADMDDFIEEYDRLTKSMLVDNDIIIHLSQNEELPVTERVNQQMDMRKIMLRLITMKPEIKTICLLMEDGKLYQFSSEGDLVNHEVLMQQPWLGEVRESREAITLTAVHDCAYYNRNQDGIVFTVGRKILNRDGAYMGMLLLDLDPSSLVRLSDGFLLARNQYNIKISITNSENGVLYDSDVASGRINWSEAMDEDILLYHKKPEDYIILNSETKKGGLSINAVIPRSDLLFKINRVQYVTVLAVFVCILAVGMMSMILSKAITSPIRRLQKRMEEVEDGEYKLLSSDGANDEIGSLIASYNHMVTKIKTLIEEVYLGEIKQRNAKLLALRTQINPHMLYNTLESIRMKALKSGADEVADMVKLLARMFRLALSDPSAVHKIRDEIEYAQAYIKLQNMRFRNMFSLEVEVEEVVLDSGVISMILQPVIENSIEHGFRGWGNPLHMKITGVLDEKGNILLQICDDGKGIPADRVREVNRLLETGISSQRTQEVRLEEGHSSIGLKNIAERIKLRYGEPYYLKLRDDMETGTVVEIYIPQRTEEENDGISNTDRG